MRKLEILSSNSGGAWGIRTRLRNQMRRLFRCTVSLIYEDERGDASVSSLIADRTEFWWSERKAELPSLWECNLHTIVRLPNSVFHPYASIGTNLLFFEKGETTQDIWFYEHSVPEGLFHDQADSAGTSATLHRLVGWGETQGPRGDRTRLEGGV